MTGTVHAEYLTYGGSAAKGTITFGTNTADQQLRNGTGNVVYTGPRKYRLVAGELTVVLPATDDVLFAETNWTWWARIELDGAPPALRWFTLPGGTTLELADVAGEIAPSDPLSHMTILDGWLDAAEASAVAAAASAADAAAIAGLTGEDAAVAFLIEDTGSDTEVALSAAYASAGQVRSQVVPGATDQAATLLAELTALEAAGGGTLVLPSGTITIASNDLTLPHDAASPVPSMNSIRIVGQGSQWATRGAIDPQGGTVLHFTGAAGTYGAIRTNGVGLFQMADLTMLVDNGDFVYTTNTVVRAQDCSFIGGNSYATCDQDVFIFGGTEQVEGGAGWTDGFQGYGSTVFGCFFNNIRRALYGRAFCNGTVFRDNTMFNQCGTNLANGAAIELDGHPGETTGQYAVGNVISGNLIEGVGEYEYGIKLRMAANTTMVGNNFYDPNGASAVVRYEFGAQFNMVIEGFHDGAVASTSSHASVNNYNNLLTSHQSVPSFFPQGLTVGKSLGLATDSVGAAEHTLTAAGSQIYHLYGGATCGFRFYNTGMSVGGADRSASVLNVVQNSAVRPGLTVQRIVGNGATNLFEVRDESEALLFRVAWNGLPVVEANDLGYQARSADGTLYKLVPPNGGGTATWVAV